MGVQVVAVWDWIGRGPLCQVSRMKQVCEGERERKTY